MWGGVYQYSDSGDWDHPHFEKIMSFQAEDLRLYALAYSQLGDPRYLQAARDIHRYLAHLPARARTARSTSARTPTSCGASTPASTSRWAMPSAGRAASRASTRTSTRARTAWAATALLALHAATGEEAHLRDAARPRSGSSPTARSRAAASGTTPWTRPGPTWATPWPRPALFLALYAATGERPWLERAEKTLAFASARFRREGVAGLVTAAAAGAHDRPGPQRDENIMAARTANLAFHFTANPADRALADEALRYLARPEVARRFNTGGVLLADWERTRDPLHVTVVGGRGRSGVACPARHRLARARRIQTGRAVGSRGRTAAARGRELPAPCPSRRVSVHRGAVLRPRGHGRGLAPALAAGRRRRASHALGPFHLSDTTTLPFARPAST